MKTVKWLVGLFLCYSLLLGVLPAQAAVQQQAYKPDVHLSFDIRANGSNETRLEVAVHPLLDPLMQKGLELLKTQLEKLPGHPQPKLGTSKRDGREYSTLRVELNSLGDLNAFVNTPQMLSGLLGLVAPGTEVPPLFTDFVVEHDAGLPRAPFTVKAHMAAETTQALSFLNLTVHVTLPYQPSEHNAGKVRGTELSWSVTPGQALEMSAEAAPAGLAMNPGIGGSSGESGRSPLWFILGGVLLLAAIGAVVFFVLRARRPKEDEVEETW